MKITNYGELKTAVADALKRRDLVEQIPLFIDKVHIEVGESGGALDDLSDDADTNALLIYNPYVYLYGAVAEGADFIRDEGSLQVYRVKYDALLQDIRVQRPYYLQSTRSQPGCAP